MYKYTKQDIIVYAVLLLGTLCTYFIPPLFTTAMNAKTSVVANLCITGIILPSISAILFVLLNYDLLRRKK